MPQSLKESIAAMHSIYGRLDKLGYGLTCKLDEIVGHEPPIPQAGQAIPDEPSSLLEELAYGLEQIDMKVASISRQAERLEVIAETDQSVVPKRQPKPPQQEY